jgi:hypothetical protein
VLEDVTITGELALADMAAVPSSAVSPNVNTCFIFPFSIVALR